jgi:hypothetical protein
MRLGAYPQDWPPEWLHAYQERVSIMEDSRVPDAEKKAEADIRQQAERDGQAEMVFEQAKKTETKGTRNVAEIACKI